MVSLRRHVQRVELFGLCPARLTITFLSLADVRPVPRPVVPYGKRSFGSRSAVLTANRAIASTERVRDGGGRRGKKEKNSSLVCGGRVGVRAAAAPTELTLPRPAPLVAPSRLPLLSLPPCLRGSLADQARPSTSLSAVVAKDR